MMQLDERVARVTVLPQATVRDAMQVMDRSGDRVVLITDEGGVLLGIMTDGDVRRYILDGRSLDAAVTQSMNPQPITATDSVSAQEARDRMQAGHIECVPLVDDAGHLTGAMWWRDMFEGRRRQPEQLGMPVVIMAGGQGSRLQPFTNILPKPLLPIGQRTILEMIMDRFGQFGCDPFYLSVNYKADLIKAYLADVEMPWNVDYIQESQPLGTAGSLSLLKGRLDRTFFVTNCDIVVDADYGDIARHHRESGNLITLVSSMRHMTVPYGVCEVSKGGQLARINEKPHFDYLVSTGFYVMEPEVVEGIADDTMIHVTDIINEYLESGRPVGVYPVSEMSWFDIGEFGSLEETLKHLGSK